MRRIEMPIGQRFDRVIVIENVESDASGHARVKLLCDCGQTLIRDAYSVRKGLTPSCGCRKKELIGSANRKHGQAKSPEYQAFYAARERCENPLGKNYHNYGKRGIEFHFTSLQEFLSELGPRPSAGHSVDRIDNDGHYEPGNVRWATKKEQANNRRNSRHKMSKVDRLVAVKELIEKREQIEQSAA